MWIQSRLRHVGLGQLSLLVYAVTFTGHALLGLPALSSWVAITIYFVAGLVILATFNIWRGFPLSLWIFYFLSPPLLTLGIGLFTAVQLYPPGRSRGERAERAQDPPHGSGPVQGVRR